MSKKQQTWLVLAIVLLALVVDQMSKVYVKTHFELGETYEVFSWFWIAFVENNGMAFGMEIIGKRGCSCDQKGYGKFSERTVEITK